jgi:hypothetical protein
MARGRIDRILGQQGEALDRLDDRAAKAFLDAYEDARRELRERLWAATQNRGADTFTAQHLRVMLAQVESGITRLRDRLKQQVSDSRRKFEERALNNLVDIIRTAEPDFRDAGAQIETGILNKLAERRGLELYGVSVDRYGLDLVEAIHRQMVVGVVQGDTFAKLIDRITAVENSPFAALRGRAETIVRTEMATAYDRAHQAALEEAHAFLDDPDDPDPLMKRADEFRDLRNHPISRVLDGMTVPVGEPFRVPIAAVAAENAKLNAARGVARRVSGVLWPIVDGYYVGNYPAHFRDRGRQVPWRRSWDHDKPVTVRKPTGKPLAALAHEHHQAYRLGDILGGAHIELHENTGAARGREVGWDGTMLRNGRTVPIALRGFPQTESLHRLKRAIGLNAQTIVRHRLPSPGVFFGEARQFDAQDVAAYIRGGPMLHWPRTSPFEQLVFDCADGTVILDATGVVVRSRS